MEYGAPTNVLIVGDGNYIVYNDTDLDQVTHIDYDDIPATLILANDIKIDGKNQSQRLLSGFRQHQHYAGLCRQGRLGADYAGFLQ